MIAATPAATAENIATPFVRRIAFGIEEWVVFWASSNSKEWISLLILSFEIS